MAAETKRALRPDPLDTASEHMAELLQRADELLLEWSKFGAGVRAQVDREAQQIGGAVCDAVDLAVRRAATEGTARAIAEQLGTQLAAVSAEVAKLETRARAATRAIAEQRRGDRTLIYGLIAAVLVGNVLLVVLLLRGPAAPVIVEPVPVATPVAPAAGAAEPVQIEAPAPMHEEPAGSAKPVDEPTPDARSIKPGDVKPEPKPTGKDPKTSAPKAELKAVPPPRPVRQGPPNGARVRPIAAPRA